MASRIVRRLASGSFSVQLATLYLRHVHPSMEATRPGGAHCVITGLCEDHDTRAGKDPIARTVAHGSFATPVKWLPLFELQLLGGDGEW